MIYKKILITLVLMIPISSYSSQTHSQTKKSPRYITATKIGIGLASLGGVIGLILIGRKLMNDKIKEGEKLAHKTMIISGPQIGLSPQNLGLLKYLQAAEKRTKAEDKGPAKTYSVQIDNVDFLV